MLLGAWLFFELVSLTFSKHEAEFRFKSRRLLQKNSVRMPLSSVGRAKLEQDNLPADGEGSYRILVTTQQGDIPFTRSYGGNEKSLRQTVDEINRFLSSSD